jgi:hypothetical protein
MEDEHDFVAGYFRFDKKSWTVFEDTTPLLPGLCRFTGIPPQHPETNVFDAGLNALVRNAPFVQPSRQFCVVELPLPKEIRSLRNIKVPAPPPHPYAGKDGENMKPTKVSMVQLFIYDVEDLQGVELTPPGVHPHKHETTPTGKIHVCAQPRGPVGPYHARDAYTKLALLFGLDIIPIVPLTGMTGGSGLPVGLDDGDLLALEDPIVRTHPYTTKGESGSNCDALVIDNTGLDANHS